MSYNSVYLEIGKKIIHRLKHKYNAKKCQSYDKKSFPSLLEKNCYEALQILKSENKILFFLRQIPFDLPGSKKHHVDFCVFTEEDVIFLEAKGRDLPMGKLKRQQVEELYNIEIILVTHPSQVYEKIQSSQKIPYSIGKALS